MSVNEPAPILISSTPASKQLVALSKLHRVLNVSIAVAERIGIGVLTRISSATTIPSIADAEFGAVSLLVLSVTHGLPVPTTVEVQPEGKAGAVTPSKFCVDPHTGGAAQRSPVVQGLPSSQGLVLFAYTQRPVAGSQESSVHTLLSLQTIGVPAQIPPPQMSPVVQANPSLQLAVLFVW